MKEQDIRPDELRAELARLTDEDIQALLTHRNEFIEVPCPACSSNNCHPAFEKGGLTSVKCSKCETVFVNPRPTFEILNDYYFNAKSIKFWNEKLFPASEDYRRSSIFAPRAVRVAGLYSKYGLSGGVLLDAGAGYGTFCEEIARHSCFKKVIAVEPAFHLAETCRKKGLHTISKPIEEVEPEEVSVVTSFELIEHLHSPREFILSCGRLLAKGGLLILTTINIKGFDLLVLGKLSDNLGGPNHINYFHPASIGILLETCGFEVLEISTPGRLDAEIVRKKILKGELDISGQPFLREILVEKWEAAGSQFQKFLAENGLSSHMWVVARKIEA